MGLTYVFELRRFWRASAIVLMALVLANCATHRPVQHAQYRPAPGSYYTVPAERGDTVASVAARYRARQDDVIIVNELPAPDRTARLSGTIRVPAYARPYEAPTDSGRKGRGGAGRGGKGKAVADNRVRGKRGIQVRQLPPPGKGGKGKGGKGKGKGKAGPYIAKNDLGAKGKAGQKSGKFGANGPNQAVAKAPPRQGPPQQMASASPSIKFLWPVSGPVISGFGRSADGARNDGINISAREGAPVRAADAGTVTYVGNELKGYGNLVLIRHDSGYVTAYAHSESVTVARGERVERGQIIAYAGATGDVNQPQVHFELRFNTKPVDPVPYLVASANPASSPARRPGPV